MKNIYIPKKSILNLFYKNNLSINCLKERCCWKCKCDLDFWDYISQSSENEFEYMIELWQNANIEFYCCECFNQKTSDLKKKKNNLLDLNLILTFISTV